jgi:hypothetical protein
MRPVFCALALVVAGCANPADATDRGAPPGESHAAPPAPAAPLRAEQVSVRGRPAHPGDPAPTSPFDLRAVEHLMIDVQWPATVANATTHYQIVDVFAPGGHLFQSIRTPFTDITTVRSGLPIAGTDISKYALAGLWRISVRLDGQAAPLAETTFELR